MKTKIAPEHSALVTLLLSSMTNVNFATRKLTDMKALGGTAKRKLNLLHSQGEELFIQLQEMPGYDSEAADAINALSNTMGNLAALVLQCNPDDITKLLGIATNMVNYHRKLAGLPPIGDEFLIPDNTDATLHEAVGLLRSLPPVDLRPGEDGATLTELGFTPSTAYDGQGNPITVYSKPFPPFDTPAVPQEGLITVGMFQPEPGPLGDFTE